MSSGVIAGILTLIGIALGAPLAALIKGKIDERLKRMELDQTKENDAKDDQDKDSEQLRADLTEAKKEARLSREDADKERQARIAEADAHLKRSSEILADVEVANTNVQRLLRTAAEERHAHAAEMEAQRLAHNKQMQQTRMENQEALQQHIERIEVLEGWITDGKPPPVPPWVRS